MANDIVIYRSPVRVAMGILITEGKAALSKGASVAIALGCGLTIGALSTVAYVRTLEVPPQIIEKTITKIRFENICKPENLGLPIKVVMPETNPNVSWNGSYVAPLSSDPKIAREQIAAESRRAVATIRARVDTLKIEASSADKRFDTIMKNSVAPKESPDGKKQ